MRAGPDAARPAGEEHLGRQPAGDGRLDRFRAARAVADAVLYEGYVLYPYRASAAKNQLRWQFGVLTPPAFSAAEAPGTERSAMRTECLVRADPDIRLHVRVRCLQVQHRAVEAASEDGREFSPVATLEVGDEQYLAWDEAIEHVIDLPPLPGAPPGAEPYTQAFRLAGGSATELLHHEDGRVAGRLVRRRRPVEGCVTVATSVPDCGAPFVKVAVALENRTGLRAAGHPVAANDPRGSTHDRRLARDEAVARSLVAVHTMLAVDRGCAVSLLDPPEEARRAVADCHNDGWFPVLVGGPTDHSAHSAGGGDVILAAPIILYDYPQVAPESPGDLYDATEIDEILALRVVTLTESEKSEARATDPRAAAIIDRCDAMSPGTWAQLHGIFRPLDRAGPEVRPDPAFSSAAGQPTAAPPAGAQPDGADPLPWWDPAQDASVDPWTDTVLVAGIEVHRGTPVRLQPSRRCDAQDLFLAGQNATVTGVFTDVEGQPYVAVTVDDDPAGAELDWQGRYLFFYPDELVPRSREDAP